MSRLLLVPLSVLLIPIAGLEAGVKLRMKFEKGDAYGTEIIQSTKDGEQSEMTQRVHLSNRVLSVAEDGTATVERTIDRMQMKMNFGPQGGVIEFDSQSKDKPASAIEQQMATSMMAVVGKAVTMTVSPLGQARIVETAEELKESAKQTSAVLGQTASGDEVEKLLTQGEIILDVRELSVGDHWTKQDEAKLPFGTMLINTTFTYAGTDDDGLHQIDATMDITLKPNNNPQLQVKAKTKEAKGVFLFDNVAGRLSSSRVKQVLELDINGIITKVATTVVETKTTDIEAKPNGDVPTSAEPQTPAN